MSEKVKMKKFIECTLPIKACNMRCQYCYVTQNKWWNNKMPDLTLCKNYIKDALSVERMGGVCMINICAAGETLIAPEVPEIIKSILEAGHYVMVVTNGTLSKRFRECCEFQEQLKKHLFFKISFHYLELKRQNKLELYFENVEMIREAGISFTIEITPDDSYIPYIDEIKEICMERLGAMCHVTVPRDERIIGYPLMTSLSRNEFVKIWSQFDSELFRFKESIFEIKRNEFCYAGDWGIVLNLASGEYRQCYKGKVLGNIYKNINEPLNLFPIGHNCQEGHCFNGHAFLGFGLIPELDTSDFADMRNRKLQDGTQWLSNEMEEFMRCKLKETNEEYSEKDKKRADMKSYPLLNKLKAIIKK